MQQDLDFTAQRNAAAGDSGGEQVLGVINRIVYHSEESGYTVCGVIPRGKSEKEEVIVVGTCPVVWEGETLRAEGKWVRHKQDRKSVV